MEQKFNTDSFQVNHSKPPILPRSGGLIKAMTASDCHLVARNIFVHRAAVQDVWWLHLCSFCFRRLVYQVRATVQPSRKS